MSHISSPWFHMFTLTFGIIHRLIQLIIHCIHYVANNINILTKPIYKLSMHLPIHDHTITTLNDKSIFMWLLSKARVLRIENKYIHKYNHIIYTYTIICEAIINKQCCPQGNTVYILENTRCPKQIRTRKKIQIEKERGQMLFPFFIKYHIILNMDYLSFYWWNYKNSNW